MIRTAKLSHDGTQRWRLERIWDESNDQRDVWIMLNPSEADAEKDDPTMVRCIGFSRPAPVGGLIVLNLWSHISSDPKDLTPEALAHPLQALNNQAEWHRVLSAGNVHRVIAAWGANAKRVHAPRPDLLDYAIEFRLNVQCLGVNADDSPKHPLYLPASTPFRPY